MSTLIIGLGNPLVTDDSIGLRVVAELQECLAGRTDVVVVEDYWGGLRLMERMVGYERAIVIDAIVSGARPGTIHRLAAGDMPTQRTASSHDMTLPTALALGRQAGLQLPADEDILIFGVEAEDVVNFGETCTSAVAAAVPRAVEEVLAALRNFADNVGWDKRAQRVPAHLNRLDHTDGGPALADPLREYPGSGPTLHEHGAPQT